MQTKKKQLAIRCIDHTFIYFFVFCFHAIPVIPFIHIDARNVVKFLSCTHKQLNIILNDKYNVCVFTVQGNGKFKSLRIYFDFTHTHTRIRIHTNAVSLYLTVTMLV